MFKLAEGFRQPARTLQPLWRYLPVDRAKDLLSTGSLYFRKVTALDDAREGTLTVRTREQLAGHMQFQQNLSATNAYLAVDDYLRHQEQLYVNCWHMNDHESYLMWKAYADRGLAIVTSYERLTAAFVESPGVVRGGTVFYKDFNRELTSFGNIFRHVIEKDLPYKEENEFRLVFWSLDLENFGIEKDGDGVRIPVDIPMLVQSIVWNPIGHPSDPELDMLINRWNLKVRDSAVPIRKPT